MSRLLTLISLPDSWRRIWRCSRRAARSEASTRGNWARAVARAHSVGESRTGGSGGQDCARTERGVRALRIPKKNSQTGAAAASGRTRVALETRVAEGAATLDLSEFLVTYCHIAASEYRFTGTSSGARRLLERIASPPCILHRPAFEH